MTGNPARQQMIEKALKEIWGYDGFRPFQAETILDVLNGRDTLTVLPTGGGKSLCYQLPAGLMEGTAVVVSPLISLMADQVHALQLLGIPAAFLNSSQNFDQVRATKNAFFRGELKMLYVSPERLLQDHFKEEIGQVRLSFFAIDEAHCISQWGHDFRPEYKQLKVLRQQFPGVGVHAFTATAPPRVQQEIVGELCLNQPKVYVGSYFRPNLKYRVYRRDNVRNQLIQFLGEFDRGDSGIIYCLTRKETEKIAEFLSKKGHRALPYHAGMDSETRKYNQERFQREETPIIVATVAFGMGIDQSNVRFVIHVGMPKSLSHYQQESGRAGRDGLTSQCILVYGAQDMQFWKRIIEEEQTLAGERMNQLRDMIAYASNLKCRHRTLVEYFGQQFEHKCNHCDICLGEIETIPEARTFSRMILSAVLKLRQNFGAAYVSQVLTGSREQKILRNRHDQLSVHNLLGKYNQHQVHDWVNQLESQGYLVRSSGNYPVIGVSRQGYWLLRPDKYGKTEDDVPVILTETRKKTAGEQRRERAGFDPGAPYDMELFRRLRKKRMELAGELGVPAFVVFGDKSLRDMARKQPVSYKDFLDVFGVGTNKLSKFGDDMLDVIRAYKAERG
ncbi:MAG: DNA helicase RecQ [Acidobacteriota bacterium]|nr:DNA helicase RecQ [Acidobacteriota bacterium]